MAGQTSLRRSLRAYQIYGANTNVGKTIMSTILCKAFARTFPNEQTYYLKPVSTGPLNEADNSHISRFSPQTKTKCLFQFYEAVSPHIAARSSAPLFDTTILSRIHSHLTTISTSGPGTLILETAGGVHSPTPSGSSQADLYRPLRLPICLVTDHRLGGISASISAFESLHIRGYDLDTVLQFTDRVYQNHTYLSEYFVKKGILSLALPQPPPKAENEEEDHGIMADYYDNISNSDMVTETVHALAFKHEKRIQYLEEMSTKAHNTIWYPFTQHRDVSPQTITAIDSAYGDFFQTHNLATTSALSTPDPDLNSSSSPNSGSNENENDNEKGIDIKVNDGKEEVLAPTFDGSASWWTQGLGHGSPELSLAASYASGRYGHVMFAGTIHAPALELATTLLTSLSNPRLTKCFFSDNGSTGMEVAIKMALTATCSRYGWDAQNKKEVGVLGLKGSYHGDTVGAMDMSEPSTFNQKVHWYKGRGYWFDFPQVGCKNGKYIISVPKEVEGEMGRDLVFGSLDEVFDLEGRKRRGEGRVYERYIERTLGRLVGEEGMVFGALVLEPVVLGAGGMLFADPLFQRTLITIVRRSAHLFSSTPPSSRPTDPHTWTGLPIIHDEVFTGLYRLGRFSPSTFIASHPDISVHAKLLTGGLVPLCTTLASQSIYDAFLSSEKSDALLHGHSYTAHPVGCHVANTSLKALQELDNGEEWSQYKQDWAPSSSDTLVEISEGKGKQGHAWSSWSQNFVTDISYSRQIESVFALGSVLAIKLQDENAGYSSNAAIGLQKRLMQGSADFKIHVRVLGNVLYIMASQTSKPETLKSIEGLLREKLL